MQVKCRLAYDWFGAGAGGVAYVGSFNWNSDTPTFVFDDQLYFRRS
jgi:hypothetical protein